MRHPEFTVTIRTGNDAFGDDDDTRRAEVARILRELAQELEDGSRESGGIYDANGNRVGAFRLDGAE